MKTKAQFAPVIFFAALFFFSCNASPEEARKKDSSSPNFDQSQFKNNEMADSVAQTSAQNYYQDQTEISSDAEKLKSVANSNAGFLSGNNSSIANLQTIISSSAARATKLDSTHRFIRTANLKFRVLNVATATYRIENLTARFEGYVADTRLTSQMESLTEVPVSKDSSLETMKYVVMNTITLRIPSQNLDTTLKCLVPLIDHLDFRNINMRDITLEILSNNLAQNRLGKYNARLTKDIDNNGQKLHDVQSAENSMLNAQESSDNALIENLKQDDAVRYSTITLYIYQRETIDQVLVKRAKDVEAYEPGLGTKMSQSLSSGWHGLQAFLMIIVILWPLWLVAAAVYIFVKWLIRRTTKLEESKEKKSE